MKRKIHYSADSVLGILFGTFIGDATGVRYEGWGTDEIPPLDSDSLQENPPTIYTDDTQMTISVFEEIAEHGTVIPKSLAQRFLSRFSPWRGYGGGMLKVIENWRDGIDVEHAAQSLYQGQGSFGNGAAMRVAPLSCFFKLYEKVDLFNEVKKCSIVTHTHPLGVDGAIVQSYASLLALNKIPLNEWIPLLFELPVDSSFKLKFEEINNCIKNHASANDVASVIGNGADALSAVSAAITSVLRNDGAFLESILFAVSLGGDADTIGAMTGAIAGALNGFDKIPNWLLEKLEDEKDGKSFIVSLVGNV
jgi:poly(ADP-ribose) glycohydrolase ARH3